MVGKIVTIAVTKTAATWLEVNVETNRPIPVVTVTPRAQEPGSIHFL